MPPITDGTYESLKTYVAGAIGRSLGGSDEVSQAFPRWLNIAIQRIEEMIPLRYCYEEKIITFDGQGGNPSVGDSEVEVLGLIPQHEKEIGGEIPGRDDIYPLELRVFGSSRKGLPFMKEDAVTTGDPIQYAFFQKTRLAYNKDLKIRLYPKVFTSGFKLHVHGYFYSTEPEGGWTDSSTHYLIAQEPAVLQYSIAEQAFFYLEASNEKAGPQHRRFLAEFRSTPQEGLAGLFYTEKKAKELKSKDLRVTVPSDINADGSLSMGGNTEIHEINEY